MIETRVLDSHNADGNYILQLQFRRTDVVIQPHELIKNVRLSLAEKIAACLFEKIEPKIMEILKDNNAETKKQLEELNNWNI